MTRGQTSTRHDSRLWCAGRQRSLRLPTHSTVGLSLPPSTPQVVAVLRAWHTDEYEAALAEIRRLVAAPSVPGVRAELAMHALTPPWEPGESGHRLTELATKVGAGLGVPVSHTATGGCADANLLAEAGAAVLDGLGPIGGADHTPHEWLDLDSVVPRVALLAGLIGMVSSADPAVHPARTG
nr:M20/M25/M40 family metallo-hydrolase [Micromonospora chaiyaphumensis]